MPDFSNHFSSGEIPNLLKLALDQAFNSAVITDAQLDEGGPHIVYANRAFCAMTGYSIDELVGKNPKILQGEKTDPQVIDRLRSCIHRGEYFQGSTVNYRKEGRPYLVEWNITPVRNEQGVVVMFVSLQQDITSHVETEQTLRAKNAELHQINENSKKMFSIIGHELKNPLLGASMLAADPELSEKPDALREIKSSIDHALELIEQLREMIQPNQIADRKSVKQINLPDLVAGIVASQRATFGNKIAIHQGVGWLIDSNLRINVSAVRQVLLNLIRNACIHSGAQNIWVNLHGGEHPDNPETVMLTLAVTDDGKGVPVDKREEIFEAFAQSSSQDQGTGIGLYVCKQVAENLNGDLTYEDNIRGGARFLFTFEAFKEQSHAPRVATRATLKGRSILFVEDSATLRMMGQRVLSERGATVSLAENGSDALNQIDQQAFDLVITDLHMPKVNGIELATQLKNRGFIEPVIGLTAGSDDDERKQFIAAGGIALLNKPLNPDDLTPFLSLTD